jgi:peroxiredoxin
VVLAVFWATWSGEYLQELPKLQQVYQQYHAQGLEVVGVSCDSNAQDLAKFLDATPGMPWPQLFEPGQARWHPLATKLGVDAVPTMLVIDRNGIVRSVEARADYEKRIPELLKDKAQ